MFMLDPFNTIYITGKIPIVWLRSIFLTTPKKNINSPLCDDYRMISVMSHVLKVLLRVIHTQIYRKCEEQIGDTQFRFQNGLVTRDDLFSVNVLTRRCRDMNIDYLKAFDCVKHQNMMEILLATGIDKRDVTIIAKPDFGGESGPRYIGCRVNS